MHNKAWLIIALPKMTIIVVGKRHHTPFYPTSAQDADTANGNFSGVNTYESVLNLGYTGPPLRSSVLGTLQRPTSYSTLASLSLVDRRINLSAVPELYSTIVIQLDCETLMWNFLRPFTLLKWRFPQHANLVKSIKFEYPYRRLEKTRVESKP